VEESIAEALDFRRAMRKVDEEFGDSGGSGMGPKNLCDEGIGEREDWMLKAGDHAGMASAIWPRLQHARPDQGDDHHAWAGYGR